MANKKLDEAPKDEFVYARDHNKSSREIEHELRQEANKLEEEEKKEQEKEVVAPKEEKAVVTPSEEKPLQNTPKAEDVEKVAREAAEKATNELKKEIDEIRGQNLSKKDEKDAIEDAKTRWTKEGRNPKDYDEIVTEAEERAVKRMEKFIEEREKKQGEEKQKEEEEKKTKEKEVEKQHTTLIEQTQENLAREIKELEEGGYIPKVVNKTDENDEGIKTRRMLFQKGIEINNERIAKGDPPENSIAKVFFMHFKGINSQPAGADAPISGNKPTASPKESSKPYVYARDHAKTFRQILEEEKAKYS